MKGKYLNFAAGLVIGATLFGGGTALAAGILAEPSNHRIFVDGQQVQMEAYVINGNNYVKLWEIGQAVGFNVTYDGSRNAVVIDPDAPYSEDTPASNTNGASRAVTDLECVRLEIVELTNALRAENNMTALAVDDMLMQAAQVRAEEMAATSAYSHVRPNGSKYYTVTDCPYTTENIHQINEEWLSAMKRGLAEQAVLDWAASAGHANHMLSDKISAIGVGIAVSVDASGRTCWYCVQMFLYNGYAVTWIDNPILTTQ